MSKGLKTAKIKPPSGKPPSGANSCGTIQPATDTAPSGAKSQVPAPDKPEDYWAREERLAREMDQPRPLKEVLPGILEIVGAFGARGRGRPRVKNPASAKPTDTPKPQAPSSTSSPKQPTEPSKPAAKDTPPVTANGANGNGGCYHTKVKRKPKRRCELVPYDELECDKGQERHHVVPDFVYRPGTRRDTSARAAGNPSLGEGLAICLSDKEHKAAHKLDKRFKGASDSTRGGAVAGTLTGGQAKSISAANVEKVTGGKKGGGCKKKDLQEQLDKQTPDDKTLRGVTHAEQFKKNEAAVRASQPQTKDQ